MLRNRVLNSAQPRLESRFILDVNVPDGTVMTPSTPFTKIWRMRNNGTLPWSCGMQLVWVGGDTLRNAISVDIEVECFIFCINCKCAVSCVFSNFIMISFKAVLNYLLVFPTYDRFLLMVYLLMGNLILLLILLHHLCLVDMFLTGGWHLNLARNLGNVFGFSSM